MNATERPWFQAVAELEVFPIKGGRVRMNIDDAIRYIGTSLYVASNGYAKFGGNENFLHRDILGVTDPEIHVDHINGDRLDNRRQNLRICDRAENLSNQKRRTDNKSGVTGVWYVPRLDRWCAQIQVRRKKITLGHFRSLELAKEARLAAEITYHGKFAGHKGARANGNG